MAITSILIGCAHMHPQIMDPFNDGFGDNEYLIIKITDTDQLGRLYYAFPEVDDKGKSLPLRWHETSKLLFPKSDTVNKVITTKQEQVRYAFEKVGGSGKFTAAAIVDLSANFDVAYKYESKSQEAAHLDMGTLKFATPGADHVRAKLRENSRCQFAYMSAIYYGTAFVEVLSNVKTAGGGNYAAFQVGGDYYTSKNKHIATSGPIIYQLTPIEPSELNIERPNFPPKKVYHKFKPLTVEQLENIKKLLSVKIQAMLE